MEGVFLKCRDFAKRVGMLVFEVKNDVFCNILFRETTGNFLFIINESAVSFAIGDKHFRKGEEDFRGALSSCPILKLDVDNMLPTLLLYHNRTHPHLRELSKFQKLLMNLDHCIRGRWRIFGRLRS